MTLKVTPNYIKNLLIPTTKSPAGRRVWSIDLENVWLPFLLATNLMGDTSVPLDALGAPIRLAYDRDGSVKFSKTGRPVTRVAKPISDCVSMVRSNFVANLMTYVDEVAEGKAEAYGQQIKMAQTAGKPIVAHDKEQLDIAVKHQMEEAMRAEKEAQPTEAVEATEPVGEPVSVS